MQHVLGEISRYLTDLGASVVLPILIAAFALLLRLGPGKALRSGVLVGVGFVGVNLVIGLLFTQVGPAAEGLAGRFHVHLNTLDVGWPSTSSIAFASQVGAVVIPMCLLLNALMLAVGLTRTFNIDLWNYWHFAFIGAIVAAVTGSYALGLLAAAVAMIFVLAIADLSAPWIQNYYKFPDISFPHGTSAPYALLALPLNHLFDRIPGLNKLEADPATIQRRFGVFGETMILGMVIGLVLGVAGFGFSDPRKDSIAILTLSVSLAAIMLILPRMVAILMEGLVPISEAARTFIQRRFPGRRFYIGLDSAIAVGQPAVIASSLLLVPVTILLAIALAPLGNTVLPLVDLATIPFITAMMVPLFRGNIVRSVLGGAIVIGGGLFIASAVAGTFTKAAAVAGFKDTHGATRISSLIDGANPLLGIFYGAANIGALALIVLGVIAIGFAAWVQGRIRIRERAVHEAAVA